MRSPACAVIYASPKRLPQYVASCRCAILRRNLHFSQLLLQADQPPKTPDTAHNHRVDSTTDPLRIRVDKHAANGSSGCSGDPPDTPGKPVDKSNYGSALRRQGRNLKKPQDIPPFELPQRFIQDNVFPRDDTPSSIHGDSGRIILVDTSLEGKAAESNENQDKHAVPAQAAEQGKSREDHSGEVSRPVWELDGRIMEEIESVVRATLQVPAHQRINSSVTARPHLVLHCPRKGGIAFLDAVIRHLAIETEADVIKLDAQDIAAIAGDFLDEPGEPETEHLKTLGYDVHTLAEARDQSATLRTDDSTVAESLGAPDQISTAPGSVEVISISSNFVQRFADMIKGKNAPSNAQQPQASLVSKIMGASATESTRDLKLALFLDTLVDACDTKRARKGAQAEEPNTESPNNRIGDPKDLDKTSDVAHRDPAEASSILILQINDYPEICSTHSGFKLMAALHDAVYQRRMEGQKIILIGTCTATSTLSNDSLLREFDTGPTRTIVTPPIVDRHSDELLVRYRKLQNLIINVKHLRHMLKRLAVDPKQTDDLFSDNKGGMSIPEETRSRLQDYVWSFDYVHRVSTVAVGIMQEGDEELNMGQIEKGVGIVEGSDRAKYAWLSRERERARQSGSTGKNRKANKWALGSKKDRAQIERECNQHERQLLNGMIDPADIRTTFDKVHASKETVQTLKDLTLLPLVCPQEFGYGILAEQNISGLLLYGPPGTGKTLLAKAVAKEGGATILEVSGADLYDKWVGESEKNVKAIFSLARKLKPCIVFIDEADAILGSRDRDDNRSSHRDLINQFLREWDGMKEISALIMVATNRPFDLDDAVVRRLPRRILIDLPTEKDREEILKIHLKKEVLDPEVSFAKLAADTPLYSGSDLKHLVVTAAQACVRENYDTANAITKSPSPTSESVALPTSPSPLPSSSASFLPQTSSLPLPASPIPMPSILSPASSSSPSSPDPSSLSSPSQSPLTSNASSSSASSTESAQNFLNSLSPELQERLRTPFVMAGNSHAQIKRLLSTYFPLGTPSSLLSPSLPGAPFASAASRDRTLFWLDSLSPALRDRLHTPLTTALSSQASLSRLLSASSLRGLPCTIPDHTASSSSLWLAWPTPLPEPNININSTNPISPSSTPSATSPQPSPPSPSPPTTLTNNDNDTPPKRILRSHHFARAMEEISASVSEDMGSLTAIKKFDEKYGDRRGRRKRLGAGFGFGTLGEKERERLRGEGARVR